MLGRVATHGRYKERDSNLNLVKICEKWDIIAKGTHQEIPAQLSLLQFKVSIRS
jgi:hypothetical protein